MQYPAAMVCFEMVGYLRFPYLESLAWYKVKAYLNSTRFISVTIYQAREKSEWAPRRVQRLIGGQMYDWIGKVLWLFHASSSCMTVPIYSRKTTFAKI